MTEKYKIYLSDDTRSRLINDAELFEFTKKDESVNLNSFLKTLIVNYFDRYRHDSENLLSNIKQDLTGITAISDKDAALLADKIISTYIKADNLQSSKNSALTLTVSGSSYEILKIIENNMLKDTSLSQYLKDMFNSYLSIPRSERETIIFKDTYEDISRALKEHRILSFTSSASDEEIDFRVEPYIIAPSKEEQCNYLLCRDRNTGTPRTFRISRLRSVFVTSDTFPVDPDIQKELQEKAIRSPHSVSLSVKAVVRLNKYGIKKFKAITKNRPIVSKIEGDLYYFDWSELQLEEYFKRFGNDAVVIKPASLKERIRKYYYYGLREYNKYDRETILFLSSLLYSFLFYSLLIRNFLFSRFAADFFYFFDFFSYNRTGNIRWHDILLFGILKRLIKLVDTLFLVRKSLLVTFHISGHHAETNKIQDKFSIIISDLYFIITESNYIPDILQIEKLGCLSLIVEKSVNKLDYKTLSALFCHAKIPP